MTNFDKDFEKWYNKPRNEILFSKDVAKWAYNYALEEAAKVVYSFGDLYLAKAIRELKK